MTWSESERADAARNGHPYVPGEGGRCAATSWGVLAIRCGHPEGAARHVLTAEHAAEEDLAERLVGRTVYVATYSHRHGETVTVHATEAGAWASLAAAARDGWEELAEDVTDLPAVAPDDDVAAAEMYFDAHMEEDGTVESADVET